jgi:hypothetical protein
MLCRVRERRGKSTACLSVELRPLFYHKNGIVGRGPSTDESSSQHRGLECIKRCLRVLFPPALLAICLAWVLQEWLQATIAGGTRFTAGMIVAFESLNWLSGALAHSSVLLVVPVAIFAALMLFPTLWLLGKKMGSLQRNS